MQVDTGVLVYPELDKDHRRFWTKAGKEVMAVELPVGQSSLREKPNQHSFEERLQLEFGRRLKRTRVSEGSTS